MNILYLGGESANFVLNLCNEIASRGHHITCIIQTEDTYEEITPHENIEILKVPLRLMYNGHLCTKPEIENIFKNRRIDVIFGSHAPTCLPVAWLARHYGIPSGLMVLDIPTDLIYDNRPSLRQWLNWFDIMDNIDEIVFINKIHVFEYEKFSGRLFPDENIITYAINQLPEYYKAGIDNKGDNVITMCRLHKHKNCIFIPKALSYLDSIKKYVAIGRDYGELHNIKKECEKHNITLEHLQDISDKEKYEKLKDALVLVYPENSEYYGSGLTPWEAMYLGIPALVPERESKRYDYGKHAFYYKGDDAKSLAKEIAYFHSVSKNKIMKHLEEAAEYSKERSSFKTMATDLIKILEKMVKTDGKI